MLPTDVDLELRAHWTACDDGMGNKLSNPRLVKDLDRAFTRRSAPGGDRWMERDFSRNHALKTDAGTASFRPRASARPNLSPLDIGQHAAMADH